MRPPVPPALPAEEVPPTALVEIGCNLCGADDPRLVCTDQGYRICRCRGCSLIYVNPQPTFSGGPDVGFHAASEVASDPAFRHDKQGVYAQGLAELDRLRPGKGRILDVGCGFGLFLDQARERGWDAFGIDVSDVGVDYAKNELGLSNVERCDLSGSGFADGSFEAVTLWNVLEHVPNPFDTLSQVRRLLTPNGVILVRVPNMVVHHSLWRARPLLRPVLRALRREHPPYLGGISPPHHLYGFTPRTLRAILHRSGFPIVDIHPAVPHAARSALGTTASTIARATYSASLHRFAVSPAIVAYARPLAQ